MISEEKKRQGGDLFIVDNSDKEWKVLQYLQEWSQIAHSFDIASGFFEIGALLALDSQWQQLEKIRILMGDEVTKRTKRAILAGKLESVRSILDTSIEQEKENNDFLTGVPAIVEAIRSGKIECRVYSKQKFHAKAYITHGKLAVVGSTALVGSSNFTLPGLNENVELNIQIRREVDTLQEWYERYWAEAEDITPEILQVIERHTREYSPFEVYAKSLQELFRRYTMTISEWEQKHSRLYRKLDRYQQDGYHELLEIANKYNGAFLCDGVGLGKTFIGMMLIERLVMHDRKRVVLLVPKSGRVPVWEISLNHYLPGINGKFSNLAIYNHTDLMRSGNYTAEFEYIKENADVVIIDEAHNFRNPGTKGEGEHGPSRYWRLFDMLEGKQVYMLTATPVNNRLIDLQHLIELFSRRQPGYFKAAPLGIHSLPGHFRTMEKQLEKLVLGGEVEETIETNQVEADRILLGDSLFQALVVQRSRAYVKESQQQFEINQALFPIREDPKVANYSIKKTYGHLLEMIEKAFAKEKPLFALPIYYPLAYYCGPDLKVNPFEENRQREVVGLIRTQFLKRFESSPFAFSMSCEMMLLKLLAFVTKHCTSASEKRRLERWMGMHADLLGYVQQHQLSFTDEEPEEDIITEEMLSAIEELSPEKYKIDEILDETYLDMDQLAQFLDELKKFQPKHDDKLQALIKLLKSDPVLKEHKVLLFTEYMATARYLQDELKKASITGIDEVDSTTQRSRSEIITQFAPYYNGMSSGELKQKGLKEARVLIATDVLSEGLNLQDATRLINYDLHWNPVRLMQRIGRVDRRLNPDTEARLLADHPEQSIIRGTVAYWNFLPPEELDSLLRLYGRVSHNTLRISKTFGIEGKKLLKPDDDYEALKDFTHGYEGEKTAMEQLKLEYEKHLFDDPGLEARLVALPGRVFSGKKHPTPGTKAVFFCYALPGVGAEALRGDISDPGLWTEEHGICQWCLYELETDHIIDNPMEIAEYIRCLPNTPRTCVQPQETLSDIRKKIDKHLKNTYLRQVQAPVGVKPMLKAWMELS